MVATLLAVYGVFMTPIGWKLAALVWGYALVWFLFNDSVKTKTYQHLIHRAHGGHKDIERIGRWL
ncbi:MAG: hypothetical protein ACE5G5_06880, partial [Candidatus Methylomirabilales bacterium]